MIFTEQQARTAVALVNRIVQPHNIVIRFGAPVVYNDWLDFANRTLDDLLAVQPLIDQLYAKDFPSLVGILPGPSHFMPLLKQALENLRNGGEWSETDTLPVRTPDRPLIDGAIGAPRDQLVEQLKDPRYDRAATSIMAVVTLLDGQLAVGEANLLQLESALKEMQLFCELRRQIAVQDDDVPGWVEAERLSITYGLLEMTLQEAVATGHWPFEAWSLIGG